MVPSLDLTVEKFDLLCAAIGNAAGLLGIKEELRSRIQGFMIKLLHLPEHVRHYFQHPCVKYAAGTLYVFIFIDDLIHYREIRLYTVENQPDMAPPPAESRQIEESDRNVGQHSANGAPNRATSPRRSFPSPRP